MKEDVIKLYKAVCKYVLSDIPAQAVVSLREMIVCAERETSKDLSPMFNLLEKEEMNLMSFYSYTIDNDLPLDSNLFTKVKRNLLSIADKVKTSMYSDVFTERDLSKFVSNVSVIKDYYKAKTLSSVLSGSGIGTSTQCDIRQRDNATIELFDFIRSAYYLTEQEGVEIMNALKDEAVREREKALIVSALMLSLIKEFDECKVRILLAVADQGKHVLVRAKVALLLALYLYNERLKLNGEIYGQLVSEVEGNMDFYIDIYVQLIKSKYTGKSGSILNDLASTISGDKDLSSKIIGHKLTLDEDDALFSKVTDKISGYLDKQNNGEDVNFSSQLYIQNEPFFANMYAFFLPFSLEEGKVFDEFGEINRDNENKFYFIYSNTYLCDVDKFHTLFSLKKMGDMLGQAMNGIPKDMVKPFDSVELSTKDLLRNYIFNMYRFYYFCVAANAYKNPFLSSLQMYKLDIFSGMSKDNVNSITNLYYVNGAYEDIVEIINRNSSVCTGELYLRKRGVALHRLTRYSDALLDLENANLMHERASTLFTLSDCYEAIGNRKKALECLENALRLKDDDYKAKIRLAELYVSLGREKQALDTLNYLDYVLSESEKTEDLEKVRDMFVSFDRSMCRHHIEKSNIPAAKEYMEHLEGHFASYMKEEDHILASHLKLASEGYKAAKQGYLAATRSTDVICRSFESDSQLLTVLGIDRTRQLMYLNDIVLSMS